MFVRNCHVLNKNMHQKIRFWRFFHSQSFTWVMLFLLLVTTHLDVLSQSKYLFKHFTYEDGLASNWVTSIIQDKDDFMWFGTSDGLSRFDGISFTNYANIPGDNTSLSENFISSLAEDTLRNCLWCVTSTEISKFDKTTHTFKKYQVLTSVKGDYTPFTKGLVFVDSYADVWVIGFSQGYTEGLFKYDSKKDAFFNIYDVIADLPDVFSTISEDHDRNLWFGTNEGLFYYSRDSDSFRGIEYEREDGTPLDITSLFVDQSNKLWIGTHQDHSLYYYENGRIVQFFKSKLSDDEFNWISTITEFDNDVLLAGIKDLGVLAISKSTKEIEILQPDMFNPNGINSKNPLASYTDRFGNVWIASYNSGINFIDENRKKFDLYQFNYKETGLPSNNVRAFYEDSDGDLWVGTKQGGGISKFNREEGSFENYKADKSKSNWLNNDIVIAINELRPGKLLVGTYGNGIYLFDKKKKSFSQFAKPNRKKNSISSNYVYAIYTDNDGQIWIGSNSSVDKYNPDSDTFSQLRGVEYARCFLDIGDAILIGTWTKGLYIYTKETKTTKVYSFKDECLGSDKNVRISGLAKNDQGIVWMATNRGLARFDPLKMTDMFYQTNDGLVDNYICAVQLDAKNNVWTSSKGGLSKLLIGNGTFKNYNKFDGLQATVFEEFVALKTNSGHMMFAGTNGFNMFHPDSIKDNPHMPNVLISEMNILNESVKIGGEDSPLSKHISLTDDIELKYSQSSFSFEFSAINYTSPEKSKYRYMMQGFDEKWIVADDRRIATYTHLPAGDYTFKVIASNSDGVWNEEGASVKIKVWPIFWKSKIASLIYFVVILVFLFIFNRLVTFRTIQKNRLDEEIRENERLEEMSRSRMRFFTNISHELRTPLTLISAPLEKLSSYKTNDSQLSATIKIMNRNAQRLLRLVNQLMDFRRVEENRIKLQVHRGSLSQLIHEIFFNFQEMAASKNITFENSIEIQDQAESWFDRGIIEKSLYNILSNAMKFTPESGHIELRATIEKKMAIIRVTDTGIGIPAETIDKIFDRFYTTEYAEHNQTGAGIGLAFTKNILELHHGTIEVKSEFKNGSEFMLSFPVDFESYAEDEKAVEDLEVVENNNRDTIPEEQISRDEEILVKKHQKEKILIVEDSDDLREYLVTSFNHYEVISCNNGEDALREAKEHMPDIVLSDVMMPKMDGLELCDRLKENFITSHIPVVLLTARASAEHKMEGLQHRADAYIEKPFNIDMLVQQISNLVQLRKSIKVKYSSKDLVEAVDQSVLPLDKVFLNKATELIEESLSESEFSVESLSAELGMSRSQLFRKFKALTNTTPSQFIRSVRLKKAAELLANQVHNVNEVAFMVGFVDSSHFIASFKKYYGQTPKQFAEECRTNNN